MAKVTEKLTIPMDAQLLEDIKAFGATERRKKAPMGRVLICEAIEARKARLQAVDQSTQQMARAS